MLKDMEFVKEPRKQKAIQRKRKAAVSDKSIELNEKQYKARISDKYPISGKLDFGTFHRSKRPGMLELLNVIPIGYPKLSSMLFDIPTQSAVGSLNNQQGVENQGPVLQGI